MGYLRHISVCILAFVLLASGPTTQTLQTASLSPSPRDGASLPSRANPSATHQINGQRSGIEAHLLQYVPLGISIALCRSRLVPTRIRVHDRIVVSVAIPIERLWISRLGHDGIRLDEAAQLRIVPARLVEVEPDVRFLPLSG